MQQVLSGQTGNGDSSVVEIWGGKLLLVIGGTFDGATVTLKLSADDGTTYVDVPDGAFTAATVKVIDIAAARAEVKLTVSGAGGSTDIDAWIG